MNAEESKILHEIHQAVIGDPKIGLTGLVSRMATAEAKLAAMRRERDIRAAYVAGAVGVVIIAARMLWEYFTQGKL